jgi:hypothetical protein
VKNILATKVDKGDSVLDKMAYTFKSLAGAAKWDRQPDTAMPVDVPGAGEESPITTTSAAPHPRIPELQYAYNIQIHLPATADISVYNAIFKSIREHLL